MAVAPVHVLVLGAGDEVGAELAAAFALTPGLVLTRAPTLREGLTLLSRAAADVVVVDLDLLDGGAGDALDVVSRAAPHAAVIVLTGPADATAGPQLVPAGAHDYLVKGRLDHDALTRSLRYALERVRAGRERYAIEKRWQQVAEHAADVIYRLALHPEVRFDYLNPAVEAVTGFAPEEFRRDPGLAEAIVHPQDRDLWRRLLREPQAMPVPFRLRWHTRGGGLVWTEHRVTPVFAAPGTLAAVDGVAHDVTLARRYDEALSPVALHDYLTGLPNRLLLLDRLRVAMSRLQRCKGSVAVFYLDLDGFQDVNDTLGHGRGDDLLAAIARRIVSSVRPGDTVARPGGDEFVVVCELGSEREALSVADRLRGALSRPVAVGECRLVVSASVGVAVTRRSLADAEELLHRAHAAASTAKRPGRAGPAFVPGQRKTAASVPAGDPDRVPAPPGPAAGPPS